MYFIARFATILAVLVGALALITGWAVLWYWLAEGHPWGLAVGIAPIVVGGAAVMAWEDTRRT